MEEVVWRQVAAIFNLAFAVHQVEPPTFIHIFLRNVANLVERVVFLELVFLAVTQHSVPRVQTSFFQLLHTDC